MLPKAVILILIILSYFSVSIILPPIVLAQTGLVAYWKFDEGSGTTVADTSGYGNTGTLTNMNTIGNATSGWTSDCKFGRCLKFDGVNDYVNINKPLINISNGDNFTISLWVYPTTLDGNPNFYTTFVAQGNSPEKTSVLAIGVEGDNKLWAQIRGSAGVLNLGYHSGVSLDLNTWNFITLVKNGTSYTTYKNAVLDLTGTFTPGTINFDTTTIGVLKRGSSVLYYFNGAIDEVRIYNRALSADEISSIAFPAETSVTKYFDGRKGAMALNYDTELYECLIHSMSWGHNVSIAIRDTKKMALGWYHLIQDSEKYGIPVTFNICGQQAVFGDTGRKEIAAIDIYQPWHSDQWWSTHTWYSDEPQNGGNYKSVGDLSGVPNQSYGLIYGGNLTERTINSFVPFEVSYHEFGHESLYHISETNMNDTFNLGVQYFKRMGIKMTAEAPPWDLNPQDYKYPIFVQNGIFVFNRYYSLNGSTGLPIEISPNLWIVPRTSFFNANGLNPYFLSAVKTLSNRIDDVIKNGTVLADFSHPYDGFNTDNRAGYQTSLAYAKAKVDSGELWATTLSQIGRYWEAKSDVSTVTQIANGITTVSISLNNYDASLFGIPYLTFNTTMPNSAAYAKITVNYPSSQTLNPNSKTVRVSNGYVVYTIYLNPNGITTVQIQGVNVPFTNGVDINQPVLSIDSTPPSNPTSGAAITIRATAKSTDAIYTVNLIYQRNNDARDSRIMTYNAGTWEASIGPFNTGDTVSYYVSVTDNSGTRNRSIDKSFVVANPTTSTVTSTTTMPATSTSTITSTTSSITSTTTTTVPECKCLWFVCNQNCGSKSGNYCLFDNNCLETTTSSTTSAITSSTLSTSTSTNLPTTTTTSPVAHVQPCRTYDIPCWIGYFILRIFGLMK